jgi:hypothetical protein
MVRVAFTIDSSTPTLRRNLNKHPIASDYESLWRFSFMLAMQMLVILMTVPCLTTDIGKQYIIDITDIQGYSHKMTSLTR